MKIRVAELIKPGRFEIREENVAMNDDKVLVRIVACGLCTFEIHHFKGKMGEFPQRIGHEPVGIVEDVGKNVKGFKVGDRVSGLFCPSFATHVLVRPDELIKIPNTVKIEHALIEPLTCATICARAIAPEISDYVTLVGCGAMGLLTLSAIVTDTLAEVIAVDLVDSKLKLAKELGATVILNPSKIDVQDEIMNLTKGRGTDIAIEAVGSPDTFELASKVLRQGRGKLIVIGFHGTPAIYDLSYLMRGTIVHVTHPPYSLNQKDDIRRTLIALEKGIFPMDRIITHKFNLENIQEAFETLVAKPQSYIKGIVVP